MRSISASPQYDFEPGGFPRAPRRQPDHNLDSVHLVWSRVHTAHPRRKRQRSCRPTHRSRFWCALRKWASRLFDAGLISIEDLKRPHDKRARCGGREKDGDRSLKRPADQQTSRRPPEHPPPRAPSIIGSTGRMDVVWHASGMPEEICSTVSGSRRPVRVRNGWSAAIRSPAIGRPRPLPKIPTDELSHQVGESQSLIRSPRPRGRGSTVGR